MAAFLNRIALEKAIAAQADRVIRPRIEPIIVKQFEEDKKELIKAFDSDPVTKELKRGEGSSSSIIKTSKGGNLFSLLGFEGGSGLDVVNGLKEILIKNITNTKVKTEKIGKKIYYMMEARIITTEGISQLTKNSLHWTSRSFIDLIENGISNFSKYLFDKSGRLEKYSVSGTAIQAKKNVRDGQFSGIPYISKILANFKNSLRNKKRK